MVAFGFVAGASNFDVGGLRVRPRERVIESDHARTTLEPLVMQLFVALSRRTGKLLTRREIFEICWGSSPAGDDSLNRLVAALRKALREVAGGSVIVETVPATGYVLRLPLATQDDSSPVAQEGAERAIEAAYDSWRLGLPEPDNLRLEIVRRACAKDPLNAEAWGALAILSRHAAEYADPADVMDHVAECEAAARRALSLEPDQPEARTALAGVAPLFGRWADARDRLISTLENSPGHAIASHDLAIVEMATGRVRVAKQIMDKLIVADPLAACYCYKSIYQHWSTGDLAGMDHVADRAIQLRPTHSAVWSARLWTLAYTGRLKAALDMLGDAALRPDLPPPFLRLLRQVLTAVWSDALNEAREATRLFAAQGPVHAIASLFLTGLLKSPDDLFGVAQAYYLREGDSPVPVTRRNDQLSINDQHRRVTQILFTPVFDSVRNDPRFMSLCERTGLVNYWEEREIKPDFLLK